MIWHSLILIGSLKPLFYRCTVKYILIWCHDKYIPPALIQEIALTVSRWHASKEDFTGSTLKLGGVKNRPVFVILFRPNLQLIVYLQYSGEPVSTLWKADCKFLVTQYLESYVAGKSLHKCLLLLLTKRLLDAVMLCFFSQVR